MNPEFIEKNQIVERYLTGKLPFQGRQEFERYCRENPDALEQLHLAEHLHAGMRLLEASGQAPGWQEPKPVWWQRRESFYAALALSACLLVVIWVLGAYFVDRGRQIVALQEKLEAGPLHAPGRIRAITVQPDRAGPTGRAALTLQLKEFPELIELHIDVSYTRINVFRLTIDKKNQARAGTIYHAVKDSNGELRFAFNTSALTAGDYAVAIEGIGARGNRIGVGWLTMRVVE
ncbi:MAG TPA: hypothetical protein VEZ88_10540 [Steroidobacteraceae bacterium]|nr:hypothetical protein [Steroidobacteraceae bacterium]